MIPGVPTDEEVLELLRAAIRQELRSGRSTRRVRETLIEKGIDRDAARRMVERERRRLEKKTSAGFLNIALGAIWCTAALLAVALSFLPEPVQYLIGGGGLLIGLVHLAFGIVQTGR